jgi:hypothetical protein
MTTEGRGTKVVAHCIGMFDWKAFSFGFWLFLVYARIPHPIYLSFEIPDTIIVTFADADAEGAPRVRGGLDARARINV